MKINGKIIARIGIAILVLLAVASMILGYFINNGYLGDGYWSSTGTVFIMLSMGLAVLAGIIVVLGGFIFIIYTAIKG